MDDHIVFFFGSGVSRPSGMPSVGDITRKVLDAPLVYTENKRYVFPESVESNPNIGPPRDTSEEHVGKVQGFIDTIWKHAHTSLSRFDRRVTYEDLYSFCGEVVSDQEESKSAASSVNPATRPFSEALRNEANDFLLSDDDNSLFHTANEATFLISGVVREMLTNSPDGIHGLDPLLAAIEESDRVTIVTLNHDLLLEQLLKEHDVSFDDGFEDGEDGTPKYSSQRLFEGPNDVTVIKPHGSINWYYDWSQGQYFSFSSVPPGLEDYDLRPEPSILSGYRKEEKYTADIFGNMVDALLFALHDTSTVIESGFGWTDPGMVAHLCRYIERDGQNQLLLLHQEDDFPQTHPLSIPPGLHENGCFQNDGLIQSLQEYLSGASWEEIKAQFK